MGLPGYPGVKMRLKERNFSALSGGARILVFLCFLNLRR
jgi:hypothetical protein